jgi:hypothetical protein
MIMGEQDLGGDQVSVSWQGGALDQGDPAMERAAAFAAVLTRTLGAAGYQPRHLSVGVRREAAGGVLHLNVHGDVPGISEPDFEALARATMNGVSGRLGFSLEGDVVLVAQLEGAARVEPSPPGPALAAEPKRSERDWFFIARLAVGLFLGLTLGVLGLPRLQLALPSLPSPVPTTAPPEIISVRELPTEAPPAVTPTPVPIGPGVLLNERFTTPTQKWPNDPNGTVWLSNGEYRMFARDPGRFVSVGVPLPQALRAVQISGQFHKINGPAGGGYGFIIRDQGATPDRDGRNQAGQYLVVEVDDRGDIGVWQRDQTRWIDILPWTHSDAVNVDRAPNALAVNTNGAKLRFDVNGAQVADLTYDRLPLTGGVGIFVGGDLNEVALESLRIETP